MENVNDSNGNEKANETDTIENGRKKKQKKIQNGTAPRTKIQNGGQKFGQNAKKNIHKKKKNKVLGKKVKNPSKM